MCGIAGIIGKPQEGQLERMVRAMHHRGPDDQGVFTDERIAIGMTRLSILDLSAAGHQPMSSDDQSIWIVYNGEMYNFREERDLLIKQGVAFKSHSDTEVVLKLYERYGEDFLPRMRGMFALAIYDKRKGPGRERVILARDQLGIKPLLYSRQGDRLLFASEMKAMLASDEIPRTVSPEGLRLLLTYGSITQPHTAVDGVNMLLPGHRLVREAGRESIEPFWRLSETRRSDLKRLSPEDLVDTVAEALEESVRLQMVSDVPLGAFLSGGLDSSLLVAMMNRVTGRATKTFSVGYEQDFASMDETADAEQIARFVGTDHQRVHIGEHDARDCLEHFVTSLDQPSVDGFNSYFVSKAAKQAVTVAISGTGGDELFAGYPWFINMVLAEQFERSNPFQSMARHLVGRLAEKPVLDRLISMRGGSRIENVRRRGTFLSQYASQYKIFGARDAALTLSGNLRSSSRSGHAAANDWAWADELPDAAPIPRVSALALRGYALNQLLRDIDAVSMGHSLEVRVPFLDPILTDIALAIPDSAKLGDLSKLKRPATGTYQETGAKKILVDIARKQKLLPEGMADQPKRGFGMPFEAWMKGSLRDIFEDTLSEKSLKARGFFDVKKGGALKSAFLSERSDWSQPWLLMITELWARQVLEKGSSK